MINNNYKLMRCGCRYEAFTWMGSERCRSAHSSYHPSFTRFISTFLIIVVFFFSIDRIINSITISPYRFDDEIN